MLQQDRYEHILFERREAGVVVATLNRPERLNAVNSRLHYELGTLFRDAGRDPGLRAMVLTGAGRGFCAGGDFSEGSHFESLSGLSLAQEGQQIVEDMLGLQKPLVCAMNGHAIGLGATLALFSDIVVAARSAKIGDPHVKMGLVAGDGGALMWPLLAGMARAKYQLFTGELMTAEEAVACGLIVKVVDDGTALDEGLAIADTLARGSSYAIGATKAAIHQVVRALAGLVMPLSLALEERSLESADHAEAVRAFQEKREPRFVG